MIGTTDARAEQAPGSGRLVVLLVEDNAGDADLVREFFAQIDHGHYGILHAETLAQALALLAQRPVDVVLLDLRLPDAEGLPAVRALRERAEHTPLVVLTGAADDALALACLDAGAQDYLLKNEVNSVSLRRAVSHAISRMRVVQLVAQSEGQLRQAQKMEAVGQLAGGLAHELNNLLGVVAGCCDLLAGEISPTSPSARHVEQIAQSTEQAAAIIRQLLAFGRKQVLQPTVFDLADVVAQTATMLRRLLEENIELRVRSHAPVGRVKADRGQIEQVIVNLALNAREAMPQGGRLILETADARLPGDDPDAKKLQGLLPGDYVLLAVKDDGPGMTSDIAARIFEPFFSNREPRNGSGLGMAMVYGIVKQSGGYVGVDSEPSRGTTVKVYLPRAREGGESARPTAAATPRGGNETLLLVEDAGNLRRILREILEDSGYQVLEAASLDEALTHCRHHAGAIHLVLTDVVMPEHSGPEVVARLRELRPELHAIFMSGYTAEVIGERGILEPGINFLQKPISSKTLRAKLREVLEAPG